MSQTIAWIEDDTDVIDPVVGLLEQEGHRILRLRSVREALDAVGLIRECDLLLLDVILPPGEPDKEYNRYAGVDLIRQLREQHGVQVPIVVLTVVVNPEILEQLRQLGVRDIVKKPVLPSKLKERVERVLGGEQKEVEA
ncbi:MAG: response regulator [Anaerolineae bacterium]